MIQFPCKCGYRFELPSDQAGGMVQCPKCSLLADVPSMNDVASMHEDGTFALEPVAVQPVTTVQDLHRAFTRRTADDEGYEKDLRTKVQDLRLVGEIPAEPFVPRYDPVTGELIRPFAVKDDRPAEVILLPEPGADMPMPVVEVEGPDEEDDSDALQYAADESTRLPTAATIFLMLLQPANTAVWIVVFFLFLICRGTEFGLVTLGQNFSSVVWPLIVLDLPLWVLLSHVGVVIESTGPDQSPDLPRPLGNFNPMDDVLSPLGRVLLAMAICLGPAALVLAVFGHDNPASAGLAAAVYLAGCLALPAVLLTSVAGATILNLRPDRLLGVIGSTGPSYLVSVLLGIAALTVNGFYLVAPFVFPSEMNLKPVAILQNPIAVMVMGGVGVFLLHWFTWHLGLIHQRHQEKFPWLAQVHVKRHRPTIQPT